MRIEFRRGTDEHQLVLTFNDSMREFIFGVAVAIVKQMRDPPPQGALVPAAPRPVNPHKVTREQAMQLGYEGDPCDDCGMLMLRRKGTCLTCDGCGRQTGCS